MYVQLSKYDDIYKDIQPDISWIIATKVDKDIHNKRSDRLKPRWVCMWCYYRFLSTWNTAQILSSWIHLPIDEGVFWSDLASDPNICNFISKVSFQLRFLNFRVKVYFAYRDLSPHRPFQELTFNFNFNISNSLFVFEGSPTTTNGGGGAWHRGARGCQREGNPLGERRPPGGGSLILLPLN